MGTKILTDLIKLNHPHIIQPISSIIQGSKHFRVFEFADGGNLSDFWQSNPQPQLTGVFVKDIVVEIRGLVAALNAVHNWDPPIQHGDIQPKNILRFLKAESEVGTFKLLKSGESEPHRHHNTSLRTQAIDRLTTMRYAAPGLMPQSRLADVWSLGCVVLELMIWMLYGSDGLDVFNDRLEIEGDTSSTFFIEGRGDGDACIHPIFATTMLRMAQDQECSADTALNDLLNIVSSKFLVVALPPRAPLPDPAIGYQAPGLPEVIITDAEPLPGPFRATTLDILEALDRIMDKGEKNGQYWFTGQPRNSIRLMISSRTESLHPMMGNLEGRDRRGQQRMTRPRDLSYAQ